jgi:hypothetical protein
MARNRTANISGELITNTIIVTSTGANVSNALVKTGDTMTGELNVANNLVVTGNVGIATTTPLYPLQVRRSGAASSYGVFIDNYGDDPNLLRTVHHYAVADSTSDKTGHIFFTRNASANDEPRLTINALGNIGIGTTNPAVKLTSIGGSLFGGIAAGVSLTDPSYGGLSLGFDGGSNLAQIVAVNPSGSSLAFYTKLSGGVAPAERLRIDSLGNLAVGTSFPVSNSLIGAVTIYKTHNGDSANIPSLSAQPYDLNQSNLFLFGRNSGITIVSKFNEGGSILFADDDRRNSGAIEYSHTTDTLAFSSNGSSRMVINSIGNVGIGTTDPGSYRLNIAGNLALSGGSRYILVDGGDLYIDTENVTGRDILLQTQSGQKVGIGTTAPSTYSRLHVYGTTGAISSPGLLYSQNLDDASALYVSNNGTTAQYDRAVFEVYTAGGSTNLFKIFNGGAISTPRNPAFFARRTSGFTISGDSVIVYDSEVGDRTGNYNVSNGRFTAPVGGYYFFRAHVQPTTSGVNVRINFWVNGSAIAYQTVGTTNLYARGDIINDIVYPLNQNDYVEVVVSASSSCGFDNHGTFGGFLVG